MYYCSEGTKSEFCVRIIETCVWLDEPYEQNIGISSASGPTKSTPIMEGRRLSKSG